MFNPVALESCSSYEYSTVKKSLDQAIADIDGLSFVKPGMKIAIKANLVSAMAPEKAVTTHPALLKRLCELITEKGATVIIGDSPGGLYTPSFVRNVYKSCGLLDLEKEFDKKVTLNDDYSIKNASYAGKSLKNFIYTGWLSNVDAIINFSKLKTHAMMGMSCAVKNMFGTIPGTTKPEYHMLFPNETDFANVMIDLNEFFKPDLYIVDAIDGMEGNGPTAGEKRHIGAVLASKRPYALDMVCADLIGMTIKDVPTLRVAFENGLGPESIAEVKIVGGLSPSLAKIPDFKRATIHQSITFDGDGFINHMKSAALKLAFNTKPQVKKSECIGCKKCYETCPAKAITMVPYKKASKGNSPNQGATRNISIPSIDRSKCIKCFCCQEFCPKGAMKVQENIIGKVIHKIK